MKELTAKPGQMSVQPIRDENELKNCVEYFRKKRDKAKTEGRKKIYDRNYMIVFLGINSALRFSDLRRITVNMIKDGYVILRDQKTGKQNNIKINPRVLKIVRDYIKREGLSGDDYLFFSRKGLNRPITREQGYKILVSMKDGCHLHYNVGTHTLRKTYGYWFYKQTNNIVALQRILNHSSPSITLIYIGMVQETVDKAREDFIIGD